MPRIWSILQADSDAARAAIAGIGCTHATINVHWREIQPSATGSLDSTRLTQLHSDIANAISNNLKVILSINLHYSPTWVLSGVEQFVDQAGFAYNDTNYAAGTAVRNWMWTATGRTYVADVISRIGAALSGTELAAIDGCRLGGGWFGELHYPTKIAGSTAGTYAWQAFGASMQSGTDLASDQVICPNPSYIPYSGTDAQDSQFLNWYLNGLVTWAMWLVSQYKAAGFTKNLYMLQPGYGVRSNQTRTSAGYKQAAALGEDPVRVISAFMHDIAVVPYSTWLNTADGFAGGTVDSDKSAWKKIYEESLKRNKHYYLIGENTGSESNSGMDTIFTDALGNSSYAGYPGIPTTGHYYKGMVWLNYPDLGAGGAKATLAHYATQIAANP